MSVRMRRQTGFWVAEPQSTRFLVTFILPSCAMVTIFPKRFPLWSLPRQQPLDWLAPARQWLNQIEFHNPQLAHQVCQIIPSRCAFERDITLFGQTYHIQALCKLNPLYNELAYLRLRYLPISLMNAAKRSRSI
uniref:Mo-dependent nitrogenase C-terminal domain-containing protein n=1 Tax=Desertifilum tharense IPPAS B-1220 TaxID=1781255 RepID=A0ACD5H0M6_9CYAN